MALLHTLTSTICPNAIFHSIFYSKGEPKFMDPCCASNQFQIFMGSSCPCKSLPPGVKEISLVGFVQPCLQTDKHKPGQKITLLGGGNKNNKIFHIEQVKYLLGCFKLI